MFVFKNQYNGYSASLKVMYDEFWILSISKKALLLIIVFNSSDGSMHLMTSFNLCDDRLHTLLSTL